MNTRTLSTWVLTCAALALSTTVAYAAPGGSSAGHGHGHSEGTAHAAHSITPHEHFAHNPKLAAKLRALLPAGTDLTAAASGFKNQGQFVAAVHVSHNLGIPFSRLKAKMMAGDSLGQAIHSQRPKVNSDLIAQRALQQARIEISGQVEVRR